MEKCSEANLSCAVDTCKSLRTWVAGAMAAGLHSHESISEWEFAEDLRKIVASNPNVYPEGWYSPPPAGIAALFSQPYSYGRLKFDTLRKREFWPCKDQKLVRDSVGILYASPIHRGSAIIGDFGLTIYCGDDTGVTKHIASCLDTLERVAELAHVGMEFRELHDLAQKLFDTNGLTNARTVTWTDKVGSNLGHTVPWSYEEPTEDEQEILNMGSLTTVSTLISKKRIHLNRVEPFKIPQTIAFTLEARLESKGDLKLPNVFYHLIIAFQDGRKFVLANFNGIFDIIGMRGIKSRYS